MSLWTQLRKARAAYAAAIRAALTAAGYADLPKNGVAVLVALARSNAPFSEIISDLHVSKQAAGQLVDALEQRFYLERGTDETDRRRVILSLSDRGRAAAGIANAVNRRLESALIDSVGPGGIAEAERTLAAIVDVAGRA